jgi:hypothetical protein
VEDFDISRIRYSYLENVLKMAKGYALTEEDNQFLAGDSKNTTASVRETIRVLSGKM